MNKQIITFSADEQKLVKTGGINCYASNIVSYIEAHFALGQNWSGHDSVRAVWSNDNNMTVISTVLDSNGHCVVPFEVLKTMGVVKVNLVGSISVSDVLADRLTTFPCEALTVARKAKINGSETAPITPSLFEQFIAIVISEVEKVTGMTAEAETLPAGSSATARYENGVLYLGIPQGIQGERGETGEDGNGIAQVLYNSDYSITFVFTNGERFTTPSLRGETGPQGQPGQNGRDGVDGRDGADGVTPSLSVGTVTTLPSTEDAYVTRRGTDENPVFDFGIPQGPKGDTGEVSLADLSSLLPTDTASGAIASFPDGQNIVPALSVNAEIEPIQDLHGYDKPWAEGANINLFDGEIEQGNISASDGSNYDVTTNTRSINYVSVIPSQTYFYQKDSSNYGFYIYTYGSDKSYKRFIDGSGIGNTFTPNADEYFLRFRWNTGTVSDVVALHPMISKGSTRQSSWTPYSNICPISGRTECVTSVSPTTDAEDGTTHTTSLGRTVYGGTLDVVSGELTDSMGYIASYNGETIGEPWISDRDEYVAGTIPSIGAEVVYTLATPQTYQLTPTEIDLLLGQNNLWTDCGSVEVTYKADVGLYIDKKLNG